MKKRVLVYFDFICPYSYILHNYLKRMQKDLKADIIWKSFELYPPHKLKPAKGTQPYKDQQQNTRNISKLFRTKMKFNGNFSRSKLAHEVYKYSQTKDKGDKFRDAVFKAYHLKGRNIEKLNVVLDIAKKSKLNTTELLGHMDAAKFIHDIHKDEIDAQAMGVRGVPTIRIGKYQLYGILDYAELKKTLRDMLKKTVTPKIKKKPPKKKGKAKKPVKKKTKKKTKAKKTIKKKPAKRKKTTKKVKKKTASKKKKKR